MKQFVAYGVLYEAGTRYGVSHLNVNNMWPKNLVTPNELKGIYSLEPPEEIKPLSYETRYLGKSFDFYSFDEWAKMRPDSKNKEIKKLKEEKQEEKIMRKRCAICASDYIFYTRCRVGYRWDRCCGCK